MFDLNTEQQQRSRQNWDRLVLLLGQKSTRDVQKQFNQSRWNHKNLIFIVIYCVFCVLWQEEVWTLTESLRAAAAVFPSSGFWVEQTELKTISYWVQKLKIALMKVLKRNLFFITCSEPTEFFFWTSAAEDPAGADIMRHKDNMTAVVQEDTLRPEDDTSWLSSFSENDLYLRVWLKSWASSSLSPFRRLLPSCSLNPAAEQSAG